MEYGLLNTMDVPGAVGADRRASINGRKGDAEGTGMTTGDMNGYRYKLLI